MDSRGPSGRTTPDEFVERLKELMAANVAGSTQLVSRFTALVQEASRAVSASPAGERPDAEALLARWLDFNLASYSVVSTQSLALLNGLISAAEKTLIATAPSAPTTPTGSRVELKLSGRPGERVTTGFAIENNFDRQLAVTFEASALTPKSGTALPGSLVSFQPATLVLEPRGQGIVQAAVSIGREFQVGDTYTATIRLLGFEAKELGLSLTILPPAEGKVGASAPAEASPKRRKAAAKRRGARAAK